MQEDTSTIREGEYHPSAKSAFEYVKEKMLDIEWFKIQEAIASTALSGNRLSEIMMGTINRIKEGKPVSDRYVLGLAWFLKTFKE